ncbi:hypothetical protein JTB14_016919 [Gonioctena quinquepunctata]|nr:hypothetical protein JTB14_016919 [Gonioctena quinquepunctata]
MDDTVVPEQPIKRKRNDLSPEKLKPMGSKRRRYFQKTVESMLGQIQKLEQVVKDMYKPKQEVKEVATRLALHAEKLKTKELANWLEQIVKNNGTEEGEKEWRKENEWLKQQMLDMEESHKKK